MLLWTSRFHIRDQECGRLRTERERVRNPRSGGSMRPLPPDCGEQLEPCNRALDREYVDLYSPLGESYAGISAHIYISRGRRLTPVARPARSFDALLLSRRSN